jgi:selenocysteine lyase/cysteine desulfurase
MLNSLELLPKIRAMFPALTIADTLFDNAGGSQLPVQVIDSMTRYMRGSFVQLNADYAASREATATVRRAHEVVKVFLNGHGGVAGDEVVGRGPGEVVIASSTTVLCHTLAHAYADARARGALAAGRDEVIVCTAGHEANVGPWLKLAGRGFKVIPWQAESETSGQGEIVWRPDLDRLRSILSERTLLVTFPHVSNILGEVWDPAPVADLAHAAGARLVVDGVAYAPHHAPDVTRMRCDWYVYSTYKVFGPHAAAMYGTRTAFEELTGPNHEFIGKNDLPYKWELGGANHESAAGIAGLAEYVEALDRLGGGPGGRDRGAFERAFATIGTIELMLQAKFLGYLNGKRGVRVVGPKATDASRVATIAFLSDRISPPELSKSLAERRFGIRQGHAYSKRLLDAMGIPAVARVSFAHYNTPGEIDRLIEALDTLI